jgi:hypothetical protein
VTRTGGVLGALSARALLGLLEASGASGTLFFAQPGASTLALLRRGRAGAHTDLGAPFDVDATGARFGFWPHAESQPLPTLPSRYPASHGAWALPALEETPLLSTEETDLRALVARLLRDAFNGALVLTHAHPQEAMPETAQAAGQGARASEDGLPGRRVRVLRAPGERPRNRVQGTLLFHGGGLAGALCEEDGRRRSGSAALRTLLHADAPAALTLHALPEPVSASLLGWLSGVHADGSAAKGPPPNFSGLELTPLGARFYRAGTPYLQVAHPDGAHELGFFGLAQGVVQLALPTDPPGWEARRYGLTLRGRDALNPMTELSLRFRAEFGRTGARALEAFRDHLSLEETAERLAAELSDLKSSVERLEAEGFIRRVGDPSPTARVYTR